MLERDPAAFHWLIDRMVAPHRSRPPDAILAVEACGFVFGAPLAQALSCRLVLARRAGKLPRPALRRTYQALGIGARPEREMEIHASAISPGMRVLVVDDVLASGGTVLAALDLIAQAGGSASGVSVAVELLRFNARRRIEERSVPLFVPIQL